MKTIFDIGDEVWTSAEGEFIKTKIEEIKITEKGIFYETTRTTNLEEYQIGRSIEELRAKLTHHSVEAIAAMARETLKNQKKL